MTTTNEKNEPNKPRGSFYELTRTILLAGIGAISLAQDEVNNFVDRMVERGEMAEADARKLVKEVTERRTKLETERRQHVQQAHRSENVTRADIEALSSRVAELTRQIEELRGQQGQAQTGPREGM